MKLELGPYINRWNTQSFEHWYMKKRTGKHYWELNDDDYTKFDDFVIDVLCDRWQTVLNFTINQYLDRKKRKTKIQLHPYDTWNMDYTLSLIILPMLEQLKANKQGSAIVDDEDVPAGLGLRSTEAPVHKDWETDDNLHKRWDWVMDELIWTFTQLVDENNEMQFHSGDIDMVTVPVDKDGNDVPEEEAEMYEMRTGPNDTHVYDREAHKKHQERISNGLMLFGKYYQGLWD